VDNLSTVCPQVIHRAFEKSSKGFGSYPHCPQVLLLLYIDSYTGNVKEPHAIIERLRALPILTNKNDGYIMKKNKKRRLNNMELSTPLTQVEAGRCKTIMHGKGVHLKYRELTNFSPKEIAQTATCKRHNVSARMIAESAGRVAEKMDV
jgi:hypothetical protein